MNKPEPLMTPGGVSINFLATMTVGDRLRETAKLGGWLMEHVLARNPGLIPRLHHFREFGEYASQHVSLGDVDRARAEMDPLAYRESLHTLHFAALWAKQGFNVFNLSHSLAAGLMLTEPPEYVRGEPLEMPFNVFAITIPPGIVPVFIDGNQYWSELIWCYRFDGVHRGSGGAELPFFRWTAMWQGVSVFRDRHAGDLLVQDDESVFNLPGDPPVEDEDKITSSSSLRLIRNLLLWLDATGGVAGHDKDRRRAKSNKRRKRGRQEAREAWPTTWVLGSEVKLQPELRRMASEIALGHSKRHAAEGWKVRKKHIVQGHWKTQPHGEGRTLRKRIHVAPYWRGPEGEAAWSHLYKPEDDYVK